MDPVLKSYRVKQKVGRLAAWVLFQGKALGGTGSGLPGLTCKAAMGQGTPTSNPGPIPGLPDFPNLNQCNSRGYCWCRYDLRKPPRPAATNRSENYNHCDRGIRELS